jgi:hypothetical protein
VEIRVGIRNSAREIAFESILQASEIEATVEAAIASGSKVVKFTDDKGRFFLVPTDSLAYIEVGVEETRRVGFIA